MLVLILVDEGVLMSRLDACNLLSVVVLDRVEVGGQSRAATSFQVTDDVLVAKLRFESLMAINREFGFLTFLTRLVLLGKV